MTFNLGKESQIKPKQEGTQLIRLSGIFQMLGLLVFRLILLMN